MNREVDYVFTFVNIILYEIKTKNDNDDRK